MLTPGEFVINRESTKKNLPLLIAINQGGRGGSVSGDQGGYGPRAAVNIARSLLNRGWSRTASRKSMRVRGTKLDRHYFSTRTGAHPASRRRDLISSADAGWDVRDPSSGKVYTRSELEKLTNPEVNALWKGVDRSHFASPVDAGDGQYILPALFGPQSRLGAGGNLALSTGGNPQAILQSLQGGIMHPFSTMMSSARILGYPSKQVNGAFSDAWRDAQLQLKSRRIPFGKNSNTFEEFMERILRRHLAKLKVKGSNTNYFDEMRSMGVVRGSGITGTGHSVYNTTNSNIAFDDFG